MSYTPSKLLVFAEKEYGVVNMSVVLLTNEQHVKILIVKSLPIIISLIGQEIEKRGIPESYLKNMNNLIWGLFGTINLIK